MGTEMGIGDRGSTRTQAGEDRRRGVDDDKTSKEQAGAETWIISMLRSYRATLRSMLRLTLPFRPGQLPYEAGALQGVQDGGALRAASTFPFSFSCRVSARGEDEQAVYYPCYIRALVSTFRLSSVASFCPESYTPAETGLCDGQSFSK